MKKKLINFFLEEIFLNAIMGKKEPSIFYMCKMCKWFSKRVYKALHYFYFWDYICFYICFINLHKVSKAYHWLILDIKSKKWPWININHLVTYQLIWKIEVYPNLWNWITSILELHFMWPVKIIVNFYNMAIFTKGLVFGFLGLTSH